MGRRFHATVKPKWELDEQGLAETLRAIIVSGYVARTDGGFIAGVIEANPIAKSWAVASEFLWWAEDGKGAVLRRGFREWAKAQGAREIRWSCPANNKRVRRAYARSAEETEIIFSEFVKCA